MAATHTLLPLHALQAGACPSGGSHWITKAELKEVVESGGRSDTPTSESGSGAVRDGGWVGRWVEVLSSGDVNNCADPG